jgi:hypothetical protein
MCLMCKVYHIFNILCLFEGIFPHLWEMHKEMVLDECRMHTFLTWVQLFQQSFSEFGADYIQ